MDLDAIACMRLARQGITAPRFQSPEAVVGWLGAAQSQEYEPARWGVGMRTIGETDASVEQALSDGRILRTHVMRPTWHFVLPADIRWLLELTAPRILKTLAYYDSRLEIDAALRARSSALVERALREAGSLTRNEIGSLLAAEGIEAKGQRLAHLMFYAEMACVVVSGPRKGRQHTYALFDERAPGAKSLHREVALAELTRRYFTSHGPATAKDMAVWANLTLADVRKGLAMLDADVETLQTGGRTYYLIGESPDRHATAPRAYLLQGFDEYIIGYNETKDVFGYGALGSPPPGAPMYHALLLDGRVVGHWRRNVGPNAVSIDLQLYRTLDATEREATEMAVQRYGDFVGLSASIGTVEGPVE